MAAFLPPSASLVARARRPLPSSSSKPSARRRTAPVYLAKDHGPARPPPPPPSASADSATAPKSKSAMSDQAGLGALDMSSGAIARRPTRVVNVGQNIFVGGTNPVVVQSMINEDTLDIEGSVEAIATLAEAGCEIVRVTVPSLAHAYAMQYIREKLVVRMDGEENMPGLVADVHHNGMKIALEVAKHVDKVRINPGLYVFEKPSLDRTEYTQEEFAEMEQKLKRSLQPLIESLKEQNKAMRIGVNHGSLAERMLFTYGDTPKGMVESALECVRICRDFDYHNLIISMKASKVPVMLAAYRLLCSRMDEEGFDYPVHLGVTEAGDGEYGRIKSSLGIGTLLAEGIGDTIRVSLTEAPINEIPVCYGILQGLGLRRTMVEYVACPSCGRTLFNLEEVLHQVREATKHMPSLSIAVMGCIVNGPGEMADADYGYVGKKAGFISLYRGREEIRTVPEVDGVEELISLLKEDEVWVDPPVLEEAAAEAEAAVAA